MYYSKSTLVDNRTLNYRFSIKSKSDQALEDLREVVALHNAEQEELEELNKTPHYIRVRARGRGPHHEGSIKYHSYIPDRLATHWDVYVVRDTEAMKRYLKRKSSKGGGMMSSIVSHIRGLDKLVEKKEAIVA